MAGRNVTFKTLGRRVIGYLWLSRIIQLFQVRCAAILALRRQPHQELQAHGIHSRQHAISGSVDSANQKSLKLLRHRKGLPWTARGPHEFLYQQKSAKTLNAASGCFARKMLSLVRLSAITLPCQQQSNLVQIST